LTITLITKAGGIVPTSAWIDLEKGPGEPDWMALRREYMECRTTFLLHVKSWEKYDALQSLTWKSVAYKSKKNAVDSRGVYAFVLDAKRHTPSPIPPLAFVLYIGETGDSSSGTLKTRLNNYRNMKAQRDRARVFEMLMRWGGSLRFYYAVVEEQNGTKSCEAELLNSLLPPVNKADFSATVKRARDAALGL